jgi:hypothetical protein
MTQPRSTRGPSSGHPLSLPTCLEPQQAPGHPLCLSRHRHGSEVSGTLRDTHFSGVAVGTVGRAPRDIHIA